MTETSALPGRARALALIVAALVACNVAAALGVALVDVGRTVDGAFGNGFMAAAVKIFQPTDAIADPSGSLAAPDHPRTWITRAWAHWDSSWYAAIAEDGYWYTPGRQSPVAFFPAYPVAIGGLRALGMNRFNAGILLTMALGCGGLFLFNRWAARLQGEERALRATALFAVYPFAFFLYGAMYSDAMFLCAAVGAFYALERGWLWGAIVLGAIATAARPIAPALVIGLVARRIELRAAAGERVGVGDLLPALAGLGLAAYMLFLWYRFGDALAFAHVQSAPGWDNLAGPRSYFKVRFWELATGAPTDSGTILKGVHAAIAIAAVACAIPIWRTFSRGYAIYVATAMGIPLISSKDFMGLGRYTIAAFPVFLMLALLLEPRPRLRRAFVTVCALGFLLLSLAFAADNQVA
jgi:hypothetical protein